MISAIIDTPVGQGLECDCLAKKIKYGVPARCFRPRRRCLGPGLAPLDSRPSCLCAAPPAAMGNVADRKLHPGRPAWRQRERTEEGI